jgi:hypothetical protein
MHWLKHNGVALVCWSLVIAVGAFYIGGHHSGQTATPASSYSQTVPSPATPTQPVTPPTTPTPAPVNTYYYCWDSGNPSPHHLGYHVSGDHICSNQELHDVGMAGY